MGNIVMNQVKQGLTKGMIDMRAGQLPISAQIASTEVSTLVPGQAVKIVDSAGGIPKVIAVAADTDDVYGFIVYDLKSAGFVAGDRVEILPMRNGIMYMEASAAIARDAEVMVVLAGQKVALATTGKRVVGRAFDKATAAGQIIRVKVDLPGALKV